jgi:phospholipase D1/2
MPRGELRSFDAGSPSVIHGKTDRETPLFRAASGPAVVLRRNRRYACRVIDAEPLPALLEPGRNCWRIEQADRASVIVDAADYFHHAREAMLRAKEQILLVGWDFDTRIPLDDASRDDAPAGLGSFVSWLAKQRPELSIFILRWDWGAPMLLARGTTIFRLFDWARSKKITFKLDGAHPRGASHHQKIVVIDDSLAFCGGIDMTATRWDTREHRDDDERRRRPTTGRRYQPWHDATMAVEGPAARALGELARERWEIAGGKKIEPPRTKDRLWPQELKPQFEKVQVALARTRGKHKDIPELREVEALYVDMVRRARSFVYIENQFFASRVVAEEVAKRLQEADGPEFVIVNPKVVEGWIEEEVMSPARAEILMTLRDADPHGRLRVYTPVTMKGEDIYVHSKIVIVDNQLLRVGSANINNRSMGLDSECDLLLDAGMKANAGAAETIRELLHDLLAEHLATSPHAIGEAIADAGSLVRAIETLRGHGRTLVPLKVERPNALESTIARKEALDPESAGTYLGGGAAGGLLRRLKRLSRSTDRPMQR